MPTPPALQSVTVPDTPADQRRRVRMVRDQLADCPDPQVVAAMATVPRHAFVPEELRGAAYDDCARPIGAGQTISQPRVVAAMLARLQVPLGGRVLDVGAGSGYTATLLSQLVGPGGRVVALERQGPLLAETRARLAQHAPTVELRLADGLAGAPDTAPFAAIHVACACAEEPWQLVAQLAPGGHLIAPVGPHSGSQRLWLVARTHAVDGPLENQVIVSWLDEVLFVPGLAGIVAADG